MPSDRKGLPESEDSVEESTDDLSARKWIRKRWRKRKGEPVAQCVKCGTQLNRRDTYYVRPAYTDGNEWLCAPCYDRMVGKSDEGIDHRYGRRRHER